MNGRFLLGTAFLLGALAAPALADTSATAGADALLQAADRKAPNNASGAAAASANSAAQANQFRAFTFKDAFSLQLYGSWQAAPRMAYHVDQWVTRILEQDFRGAAHLWTQVRKDLNPEFRPAANAAYAYLLWKLELPQEFLDQWLEEMRTPANRDSKAMSALIQTIEPGFANWLVAKAVMLRPEQSQLITQTWKKEPVGTVFDSLRAWALLRTGLKDRELALQVLGRLPMDHALKIPLAQTLALGFARAEQLPEAGQILKHHLEPAILKTGKTEGLAQYYMQIARLLYQADALDAAEAFYRKVPNSRPEFLTAREELGWILLRKGDVSRLRGELKNFRVGLTDDKFLPETFVVSAVTNLKLCYYKQVQEDMQAFAENQKAWADRVERELASSSPARPLEAGFFVELAERAGQERTRELERIRELSRESINAALPAVGVQAHWQEAEHRLQLTRELAEKTRSDEYRRVWKNWRSAIAESIRKMKFVKVELLSQLSDLAMRNQESKPLNAAEIASAKKLAARQDGGDALVFPFDGTVWQDELFKLHSVAEGVCL